MANNTGNFWGEPQGEKWEDDLRIALLNVDGLPERMKDPKNGQIFDWWDRDEIGVAMLTEVNRHWPSVAEEDHWRERVKAQNVKGGVHSNLAYNRHGQRSRGEGSHQYGGVGTFFIGKEASSIGGCGQDPSGLGRWAWTRMQGKDEKMIRFVTAYRPNPPGNGANTVWAQHRLHLLAQGDDRDPQEAFLSDLRKDIRKWKETGDHIIIGMDANDDLRRGTVREGLAIEGLHEVLLDRHAEKETEATYHRNHSKKPIDGIFATTGIKVSGGGYYGWDESVPSTHRALWLDIPRDQLLGRREVTDSFDARRLKMEDPRVTSKYTKYAETQYRKFGIGRQLHLLHQELKARPRHPTKRQQRRFNWIQKKAYSIRKEAEKHCRKLRKGKVPWSPAIQLLRDKLEVYRLLIKQSKRCRISSRRLRRYLKKAGLADSGIWRLSLQQLEERRKRAWKKYKRAKKNAPTLREEFLRDLARARAEKKGTTAQREKKRILQEIRQREEARRSRNARGKGFTGGLKRINIPVGTRTRADGTEETLYQPCTTRPTVERGCATENIGRFSQTSRPFRTPPRRAAIFSKFNGKGAKRNSDAVLRGTYPTDDIEHPQLQRFLEHCRYPVGHRPLPATVTLESHTNFWAKMTEKRSSEPHGLHNGHFKAGAESAFLAQCDTWMRDIPYMTGMSPAVYRHLLDYEIEKAPGVYNIDKMRTIELMNSEMNTNNKLMARDGMRNAEHLGLIPAGQYGSRQAHRSADLGLCKRFVWDSLILSRTAAGWCSNDAKSCFDRIVHWIATLCLLRFGIPWEPIRSLFLTLQTAVHRLRTGFGDSTLSFKSPRHDPFQGCGQGNGAGPAMWVAISAVLISMVASAGFGFHAISAISLATVTATCFSFVDDTDVCHAAPHPDTPGAQILPEIQAAIDMWVGGVSATGGAVRPDKSFWCLIDHIWVPAQAKWRLATSSDIPATMTIEGVLGEREQLRRVEPSQPEETLGIFMAVNGSETGEVAKLEKKTRSWAETIRTGYLQHNDVLRAIKTTIQKTLEYPMSVIVLTRQQWEKIFSPVLRAALPKSGVCRTFPREVVYGPLKYQGLGVDHPFSLQVEAHVVACLRHGGVDSLTGKFFRNGLEAHQLELGLPLGVFQNHFDIVGCLASDTWIKRVWGELHDLDMHLAYKGPDLPLHRHHDTYIIQQFVDLGYTGEALKKLNWCRMHLHAVTVSDITGANGTHILQSAWQGRRDPSCSSRLKWPRLKKPTQTWWTLWQEALRHLLANRYDTTLQLATPLGNWLAPPGDEWNWHYSPSDDALYFHGQHMWRKYKKSRSSRTPTFTRLRPLVGWTPAVPQDLVRASVTISNTGLYHCARLLATSQHDPLPSTDAHLSVIQKWRHAKRRSEWTFEHLQLKGSEDEIAGALKRGTLRAVSDGSYKCKRGTAAFIVTTADQKHCFRGRCHVPGLANDQSAYRSEIAGILCGVQVCCWLEEIYGKGGQVTYGCDGKAALRRSLEYSTLNPKKPQFDILSAIHGLRSASSIKWTARHIKGHQDKHALWGQLDWWARRNVEVDATAQIYRQHLATARLPLTNPWLPSEQWAFYYKGHKQSSVKYSVIAEEVTLPLLRKYWVKKGRYPDNAHDLIDWDANRRAMEDAPVGLRRWTTKHATGMCGVGKFLKIWGREKHDKCPLCGLPEDAAHVPLCPDQRAAELWDDKITDLDDWLTERSTSPPIQEAILDTLRCWHTGVAPSNTTPISIVTAVVAQRRIGPRGLFEGLLAKEWAILQDQHYRSLPKERRSGSRWASLLIEQLWIMGFNLWEHRNQIMHSPDSVHAKEEMAAANTRIHEEYGKGSDDLPREAQHLFRFSLQRRLDQDLPEKERWLALVKLERDNAYNRDRLRRQQRRRFERHFQRPTHPNTGQ